MLAQIFEEISKMLQKEEKAKRYYPFKPIYPIFTADYQEKAAAQLQKYLENKRS